MKSIRAFRLLALALVLFCVLPLVPALSANAEKLVQYDVNRDGMVNIADVTAILNVISGHTAQQGNADVSGNGTVNINDVTVLLNLLKRDVVYEPDKRTTPQDWLRWLVNVDGWKDAEDATYKQATGGSAYNVKHDGASQGSPWEFWGGHFQFDYTFLKEDFDTTFSGSPSYHMEIWYRDDDAEDSYKMITTAPWSFYDWGSSVICRIPTYEKGMHDLHTDNGAPNDYEIILLFYDAQGRLACWKQDWISVTDSYEMFLSDALSANAVTENNDPVVAPGPAATQEYEDQRDNTVTLPHKTEDDLDVIHVGLYEFVLPDGRKFGYNDDHDPVILPAGSENTSFLVSFQNSGRDSGGREGVRYVIYEGDSVEYSLRGSYSAPGFYEARDDYMSTNWYIVENADGTVSLRSCSSNRYLTVSSSGAFNVKTAPASADIYKFTMNLLSEGTSVFHQTISATGNIVLRISDKVMVRGKLSYNRQAKLANDLQTAYETYYELTGYRVWESIIARVYQPEPYFGYIYPSWNVISFNLGNAIDDLGMIFKRDKAGINDWNFCLLHEMGHMFDAYRGWKFDAEFCTDLKIAYVLYKNQDVNAKAATSGRAVTDVYGTNIKEMWNTCPKMTEETGYNLDRVLYLFTDYCERIGWENVKKAYHEIQDLPTQETNKLKCYQLFTSTLQKYAPNGEHVEDFMEEGEREIIIEYLS